MRKSPDRSSSRERRLSAGEQLAEEALKIENQLRGLGELDSENK